MRLYCLALAASLLLLLSPHVWSNFCQSEVWSQGLNSSCYINQVEFAQALVLNASTCTNELETRALRMFVQYQPLFDVLRGAVDLAGKDGYTLNLHAPEDFGDASLNVSLELSRDILSYYDAFVVDAESLPELAGAGVITPLDALITQVPNWFRINRYYRGYSSLHERKTYGVPLSGVGVATFYRKDLFDKWGLEVPGTWDDVLSLARRYTGVDLDGSGAVVYPFCMSYGQYCAETLLLSVAAPFIQNNGASSGLLIDPSSGQVMFNSSAFQEAFSIWRQLAALGPQQEMNHCQLADDYFSTGRCLMTVQPMFMFKLYASSDKVKQHLGVAMAPGSSRVLNRTSGRLEGCTSSLCPLATVQKQEVLVNSAPFMWGGLVATLSSRNPRNVQADLIRSLADVASTNSLPYAIHATTYIAPFRSDHWSAFAKPFWDASYPSEAADAMRALLRDLYACHNLAPPLRLPGQADVRKLLYNASRSLLAGGEGAPAAVAAALQQAATALLQQRYGVLANGTPGYLELYRRQVGYFQSTRGAQPPPRSRDDSGVSRQTVVVIAVVLGLVVLLAAVVVLEVRNKRRHKDLLGRVKPPLGDPDTTIVVASIQDFDELWEALVSDASERALQQFTELVDVLLRRHSGYRAASEEEDVVAAFHCPRDAVEFALELQRGLLEQRWPKHVLEMEQFRPHYLTQTKCASFSQNCNENKAPLSPLNGPIQNEDEDKLFTLDTNAENVRSFGEQCVASWSPADAAMPDAELAFCGIRARVGVCAVGFSCLTLEVEPGHRRYTFAGEAVEVATAAAVAAQGGMVLIPQSTFRQLHLEVLAEQCLFCHLGEYQLTSELAPMDLYLALDRQLLGRLALFGPLACHMQWSQGAFAAPVHSASMVFTHVVGVQTLLAWDYDLMQDVIETFTKLAQVELQQAGGYLVEHVEGFMLTAFHSPADAILWGLRMQELMLKENWPQELLEHELCEEVTVTVPVRGGEVTSATVFRGPRLKTGIDIGKVLARLHTMTGRMTYRGKVMNRAARISAAASSGQVLCSAEAWESCTASASALRLVTATSLGLFQLKGIQERIEVFHCTYQRHMASSTRRSSTVSVGLVSSSDNRRKSAVVLSSLSHISHHTTSYRTSQHNSAALEQVSASDGTGGRRGSTASSAVPAARGSSLGVGHLSDMLHIVGADQAAAAAAGGGGAAAGTSPARYRSSMMPIITDGSTVVGVGPLTTHTSNPSHKSQQSQVSGGGTGAPNALASMPGRAALAAVLQSRTRSASAIQSTGSSAPLRTQSARSRRVPGTSAAVASEPQVSLLGGGGGATGMAPLAQRYMATSPSASPSLAMAAAAAAAASCERTQSPKATAALDKAPNVTAGAGGCAGYYAGDGAMAGMMVGGGTGTDGLTSVSAAIYAMLPSVVLSSNLSPSPSPATSGYCVSGQEARAGGASGVAVRLGLAHGRHPPATLSDALASDGGGSAAANASVSDATAGTVMKREPQPEFVAASASDIPAHDPDTKSTARGTACTSGAATVGLQQRAGSLSRQPQQSSPRPMSPAAHPHPQHPHHQHPRRSLSPPRSQPQLPQRILATAMDRTLLPPPSPTHATDGPQDSSPLTSSEQLGGPVDDGSRVETLEVTLSATGIVRGGLSGAGSSANFGTALGSSQGPCISRSGSNTTSISYLAMAITGTPLLALQSGPGGTAASISVSGGGGGGGGGSLASSSVSSGLGLTFAQAQRPQSATGRSSLLLPLLQQQGGQAGLGQAASVRHYSGSVNSVELFLPFPLGGGTSATGGGGSNSTSSGITLAAAASSSPTMGGQGSGQGSGAVSVARTLDGMATAAPAASALTLHLQRQATRRLAAVAAAAAAAAALEAGTANDGARAAVAAPAAVGTDTGHDMLSAGCGESDVTASTAIGAAIAGSSFAATAAGERAPPDPALTDINSVPSGLGESCSYGLPESKSNSSVTAAAGSVATGCTARREEVGGGSGSSTGAGVSASISVGGSGCASASGSGRLGGPNRTGSGTHNEATTSHAASPSCTWISGGSAGSTTTMACTASTSSVAASQGGQAQGLPLATSQSIRLLLGAGLPAMDGNSGFKQGGGDGSVSSRCDRGDGEATAYSAVAQDAANAAAGDASKVASGAEDRAADGAAVHHGPRLMGDPLAAIAASRGSNDAATAALAAAFGVEPPAGDYVAAAAAFGVGPSVGDYEGCGVGAVSGPSAKELEMAYELLGESRHAGGSGWP